MDDDTELFVIWMMSSVTAWIFGSLFFVCEIGDQVTFHFDLFGKELERFDWHMLPIKTQQFYSIFLSDTQQAKNIECYGNVLLTRESFKRVFDL